MKKILLINPVLRISKDFIDYPYFVNIGMYQIREILREKGYAVETFDAFCKGGAKKTKDGYELGSEGGLCEQAADFKPDFAVILNSPFLGLFLDEENKGIKILASILSKSGAKTILADCFQTGMHYYDYDAGEIKEKYGFDFVCRHECEESVTECIEHGKEPEKPNFKENLDELPIPSISQLELDSYNEFLRSCEEAGMTDILSFNEKTYVLASSRGCIHDCAFCSSRIYGRRFRMHSGTYLSTRLSYLAGLGVRKIIFLDDLLNPSIERMNEILGVLKKQGMRCEIPNGLRADCIDRGIIESLKGVTEWIKISAETGSEKTAKLIGKNLDIKSAENIAKLCYEGNIPLFIHYIIGFPGESIGEMNKTLMLAANLSQKYGAKPLLQFAAPIKGSRLYSLWEGADKDYMKYFRGDAQGNKGTLKNMKNLLGIAAGRGQLRKIIVNCTYKCNNNCIFCAIGDRRNIEGDYISQVKSIINARAKGADSIDFDGGEPTLSSRLFKLIKKAKDAGYSQINLTTNGRLLSNLQNAQRIANSGITSILLSLHGPNADIHEKITRSKGSFIETVKGIDNILKLNKKGLDIGVNITLSRENAGHLPEFAGFVRALGVKKLNIQALTPFGAAREGMLPCADESSKQVLETIKKYGGEMEINLVNFLPCFFERQELSKEFMQDFLKSQRNMMFIDRREQNLADFLGGKRKKMEKCAECEYGIICTGEWVFK